MTDYGSGALADWTANTPSVSTDAQFADADVWMLGDSIAIATQRDLATQLGTQRGQTLAVHDWSGRPTAPTVDALEQLLGRFAPAPQIIMACGTNDIFDPTVMAAQIARAVDLVDPTATRLWWKTVHASRWSQPAAVQVADQRNSGWVNAQLHAAAGGGSVELIDWAESLAVKPSRIGSYLRDGVHPNDTTGVAFHNAVILGCLPTP